MRFLHPDNSRAMNGVLVAHAGKALKRSDQWSTVLESETVRNVYLAGRHPSPESRPPTGRSSSRSSATDRSGRSAPTRTPPSAPRLPTSATPSPSPATPALRRELHLRGAPRRSSSSVAALVFAPQVTSWGWLRERLESVQTVGFLRHRGRLWGLIGPCEHQDLGAQDHLVTAALLCVTPVSVSAAGEAGSRGLRAPGARGPRSLDRGARDRRRPLERLHLSRLEARRLGNANHHPPRDEWRRGSRSGSGADRRREATCTDLMSGGSAVLAALMRPGGSSRLGLWCWRVRLRFSRRAPLRTTRRRCDPSLAKANPPGARARSARATGPRAIGGLRDAASARPAPGRASFVHPGRDPRALGMSIPVAAGVIKLPAHLRRRLAQRAAREPEGASPSIPASATSRGPIARLGGLPAACSCAWRRGRAWQPWSALPPRLARPLRGAARPLRQRDCRPRLRVSPPCAPSRRSRADVGAGPTTPCKTLLSTTSLRYAAGDPTSRRGRRRRRRADLGEAPARRVVEARRDRGRRL